MMLDFNISKIIISVKTEPIAHRFDAVQIKSMIDL